MTEKLHSKGMMSWYLFDWGNTAFATIIITFVYATFFTEHIAANHIEGSALWGYSMGLAGILIVLIGPILGAISDVGGRRKIWLIWFVLLEIFASAMLWNIKPESDYTYYALFFVILGDVGMEISAVFYNAMLNDLVSEKSIGKASGFGWGAGYLGGLTSLVLLRFFILNHDIDLFLLPKDQLIRLTGPFVALWMAIFSIPLFLFSKDREKQEVSFSFALKKGFHNLMQTFKSIIHYQNTFRFMIARMIYTDGLNTIFAFGGIYAAGVFHMEISQIIIWGIAANISAGIGAIVLGWLDDMLGSKTIILISLTIITLNGIAIVVINSIFWFWIFGLFLCFFVGSVQSSSRSLFLRLAPKELMTEMFGFYALSGKITGFIGPWLMGLMIYIFNSQRVGMSTILIFFIIGGILLLFVHQNREILSQTPPQKN